MVHYQRYYYQQLRKGQVLISDLMKGKIIDDSDDDEESQVLGSVVHGHVNGYLYCKRGSSSPRIQFMVLFCMMLLCTLICVSRLLGFHYGFNVSYSLGVDEYVEMDSQFGSHGPLCSSITDGTICCDRSSFRTDICFMKGDIRTIPSSSSLFLYTTKHQETVAGDSTDSFKENDEIEGNNGLQIEKITPYTRKWETSVMNTIEELKLITRNKESDSDHKCNVSHDVPAVVFSTGGYTGNVYHEFNDGILPLYITSQHFNKKVVFVILEYHKWWYTKYGDILSLLSDYRPVDFNGDNRTHCFSEAIVGLRIHDELTIDSALMEGNKTINDFRTLLDRAYWPRIKSLIQDEEREQQHRQQEKLALSPSSTAMPLEPEHIALKQHLRKKPLLTIMARKGSRAITNQDSVVRLAKEVGFEVNILSPKRTMELAKIYRALNSSDAMMGVHGAAMTHFMFMRPKSVFIQVVPLGTEWAAETYYGEPATKLGLKYIKYSIHVKESSLYKHYRRDDPVLTDPNSVVKKGWEFTKRIYLDDQTVKLDLRRFRKRLVRAYEYCMTRRQVQVEVQTQ
ncbi:Xylan glycosyltransferase MUCI21-like protein [Drosera capensis]